MSGGAIALRAAAPADIPFIVATERMPGFEKMVGRWSEKAHRAAMANAAYAYLLGVDVSEAPKAFAIVRDLDDAHDNVCLKRMAVVSPGHGVGTIFLGSVVEWAFTKTKAYRIWLDVLADNARARHVYASHGFIDEGRMRSAYKLPDETRIDLVLMSLTRPDWQARQKEKNVP